MTEVDNIVELNNIISSIFRNDESKEEFLKHYANVFFNQNKGFDVWYGKGNNGKTLLFKLFERTFVKNITFLPGDILRKRPKIERIRKTFNFNVKMCCITETNEKINEDCVNDLLRECKTILLITNTLDILPENIDANIINFESIFSSNSVLFEKLEDPSYCDAFMEILKSKL